ncbi:unnamed protein product [Acanthoscelides obtectus]|uniref:Uncharacterized protein n=1 Tax=Acanthoscelides obtectus TaxID=200917 RepID=A0A9P0KM79_ACAOB|nr:unnamed protein product [Acanthoscelides obtectus]CAK1660729.1 Low-density lipoprotein receptor-related protein 5 [Acanthoscelides obtectus]
MDPKLVHYCNYRHYYKDRDLGRILTISRAVQENDFNKNIVIKRTIFGSKCVLKINEDVNLEKRKRKARIRLLVYVSVGCSLIFGLCLGLFFILDKGLLKRHTLVHIRRPQVLKTNGVYTLVNETFVENDNTRNVTNKRKEWHVTRNADPKNLITNSSHTVTNSSKSFSLPLFCKDCRQDIDICFKMSETEIPRCMEAPDMNDPTGCGGFCQINTHFCQTLDTKRKVYQCLPLKNILWCPEGFFSCGNMCISERKRCNGLIDCSNKADEEKCACDLETHFHCGNQTSCLELSKKCDKQVDCWDQSDEKGCDQYYSACQENELPCSNGLCIEQQLFCDGQSDCEDGSDEPEGCQT